MTIVTPRHNMMMSSRASGAHSVHSLLGEVRYMNNMMSLYNLIVVGFPTTERRPYLSFVDKTSINSDS